MMVAYLVEKSLLEPPNLGSNLLYDIFLIFLTPHKSFSRFATDCLCNTNQVTYCKCSSINYKTILRNEPQSFRHKSFLYDTGNLILRIDSQMQVVQEQ